MLTDRSLRKLAKAMDMLETHVKEFATIYKQASMEDELIGFLADNPDPPDSDVHAWAEEKGYDTDEVETAIYKFATLYVKFLTGGDFGESGMSREDFDPEQLRIGTKEEMKEHGLDEMGGEKVAMDHLSKIKDYYTLLKKMEDSAKE